MRVKTDVPATQIPGDWRVLLALRMGTVRSADLAEWSRYEGAETVDALNRRINDRVNEAGRVYATPTELDGRYVLRACIINYATRAADVDAMIEEVRRAGAELAAEVD